MGLENKAIRSMSDKRIRDADVRILKWESTGVKPCRHCGALKNLDRFEKTVRQNGKSGYSAWCKECGVEKRREVRQRKYYNLSLEDVKKLDDFQGNKCAICNHPAATLKKGLQTDHDHKTGLIRGRLCWLCNKILGLSKDNPDRLLLAALYLVYLPAVTALGEFRYGLPGQIGTKKQARLAKKLKKNPIKRDPPIRQNPFEWMIQVGKTAEYLLDPPAKKVLKS